MSIGGWAGDTATKFFQPVEKAVVQPLNKTIDAIIKNPIPTISTIALTAVGIPYPIANAAVAAANGGDVKSIALTIASAYAGEFAAKTVGSNISAIPGVSSLAPETQRILATIAASASGSGTAAALSGRPLSEILTASTAGAVSGLVSDQLKANNVLQDLQAKGFPQETINNLIVNASNNATIAIIQGRSIADAVTNSTVATLAASGLDAAAKTISDGYNALLKNSETLQSIQSSIDELKKSAVEMFDNIINPKQEKVDLAYDMLLKEYQDYLAEVETYNSAADKYNSEKPKLHASRIVYGPGWLNGGYIRIGASGPGERQPMPKDGYFVPNSSYGYNTGTHGDIYVKPKFTLTPPSDVDYKKYLSAYTTIADDFTKSYQPYQDLIDEINKLSEEGQVIYDTMVADSEVLGKNVADYVVKENEIVRDVVENITTTATADVERELIRLFEEEQAKGSTPSPYEPIAGGGVASDVEPTPLVPTTPGGSVDVIQVPDFEPTTPTTPTTPSGPTVPSGQPLTPSEIAQFKAEGVTNQEINDLINKLGLRSDISAGEIFNILNALEPPKQPTPTPTPPAPTTPTTPPVGPQPEVPEIEGVSPPPEISETPLEPETPAGPVIPPTEPTPTEPQPTAPGAFDEEERRRELMRLLGLTEEGETGTGTQPATGGGMTGGGGIGAETGEEGTSGAGGGEGTGPTPEDEGEFVDQFPREPLPTLTPEGFTGRISTAPVSATVRRSFLPAGAGQSDSLLGSLLGTALTPTGSEPILGEDESKRKAVWNLESLRNALGI